MKKIFATLIILLITIVSLNASDVKKYGKEITLSEKTKISEIMANPENFVGKKVLIEGNIVDVCEKRGCWMDLSSDKEFETIKVKVNDGEIVFPIEAKGKKAVVEGEVYSLVVEGENCGGDCKDEHKSENDEEHKCEKEKSTKKVYQIKGLGAVVE